MPQPFQLTSSLAADECARRLKEALHASGAIHPAELPRALADERIWGTVDHGRFELQYERGFNQSARGLTGMLEPHEAGTLITGELADGAQHAFRLFVKVFFILFGAFTAVPIALALVFGNIGNPLLALLVPPLWAGFTYLFWRVARRSLREDAEAPITYLRRLLR